MSKMASPYVATFVAAPDARFDAKTASHALEAAGVTPSKIVWLDQGAALDVFFDSSEEAARAIQTDVEKLLGSAPIDVIAQSVASRRKALLVADMDATMIAQECLDELAQTIGQGEAVAVLTARAMHGEIDFESALTTRVALFEGVSVESIEKLVEDLTPNPGARLLVATMRKHGAHTALVSGGFTLFAAPVGARLHFHDVFANRFEIENGRLTGRVTPPIRGKKAKGEILAALRDARGLEPQATLAIGDGANDLDMLAEAGLGVAFRAKPQVAAMARARLNHADLTALLFAQGFAREDFAEE
jgi:phosphoserine phosphatase